MASVCSFDAFLVRSFEPYGPDRLAGPPPPFGPAYCVAELIRVN